MNRQDVPASHLLVKANDVKSSDLPNIEEALEIYFSVIGKGRQKLFFTTARRYVGYLIQCLGIRPIDEYSSKDATILREWLVNKGLSKSSLRRAFSSIKAVINFVILEHGLTCQNPFTKVYLPNNDDAKKRHAITEANRLKIQRHCLKTDDDIRWLVSLIMDSWMRLSEAAGLMNSDIYLDNEIPYITVRPHPHRRLKTASSQRKIPLVGSHCGLQIVLNRILWALIASLDMQARIVAMDGLSVSRRGHGRSRRAPVRPSLCSQNYAPCWGVPGVRPSPPPSSSQ